MAQTALVLGGSGFLGAHLVRALRAARPSMRCVSAARRPGAESREGVLAQPWDALDRGETERLFAAHQPSVVILAAALSRVGDCDAQPALAEELNAHLPGRIAGLAAAQGVRLVHVSTDLVFGGEPPEGERYAEADAPSPLSHYGKTKAQGELAALEAGALVVRLPLLFGDSGGRGLGASDALFAALERGEQPGLFRDEWRTPLEVSSAARALVELATSEVQGLLHVAGSTRLSRHELGCRLLDAAGRGAERTLLRSVLRSEAGHAERASDVSLDGSRALPLLTEPPQGAPPEGTR